MHERIAGPASRRSGAPDEQPGDDLPRGLRVFTGWVRLADRLRNVPFGLHIALLLASALLLALRQLDRILMAMHAPGEASYGLTNIAGGVLSLPDPDGRAGVVTASWAPWPSEGFRSPETLAFWYLGLDLVFIAAYAWVLSTAALRIRGWLHDVSFDDIELAVRRRMSREPLAADDRPRAHARIAGLRDHHMRVMSVACAGVLALAVADLVENAVQAVFVAGCVDEAQPRSCAAGLWTHALWAITELKWALALAVCVALASGVLAVASMRRDRVRELGRVLVRLRAPLALVAFLGFGFLVAAGPFAEQAADLLRAWSDDWTPGLYAIGLTIVLAGALLTSSQILVRARAAQARPTAREALAGSLRIPAGEQASARRSRRGHVRRWVALATVLAAGIYVAKGWPRASGLLALAIVLIVLALLSAVSGEVADDPPSRADGGLGARSLPAALGVAPLVVLGLAVQGAALGGVARTGDPTVGLWALVGVGVLLQIAGWGAFSLLRRRDLSSAWSLLVGGCVALLLAVMTRADPWNVGEELGGVAVVVGFATALALLGLGLGLIAEHVRPPSALRLLGFRRTPFVILVLVWGVLAAKLDDGGFHDVRLTGTPEIERGQTAPRPRAGVTLEQLFARWRDARGLPDPPPPGSPRPTPSKHATPLVLVASSGGGMRAAYWTARTMDCLFAAGRDPCAGGRPEAESIVVASGVSGGSLGLASWRAHVHTSATEGWLDTLRVDALTPALAWGLFVDLPNSLLHSDRVADRAEILERSWERAWVDEADRGTLGRLARSPLGRGLFETLSQPPLLLLNGTSAESSCRLNASVLDASVEPSGRQHDGCLSTSGLEPGNGTAREERARVRETRTSWALGASLDLNRFVCDGQDVRVSTAVLLSARFPYVSPSGRLAACDRSDEETFAVDGGYYDPSAAATATELWTALEPIVARYNAQTGRCVVPFAIQIDNGYDEPPGPDPADRPLESVVPLQTGMGTRGAHQSDARQALALAVAKPVGEVQRVVDAETRVEERRHAHVYPRAHPGIRAPLGWALSASSEQDLDRQLDDNPVLKRVRSHWLTPRKLACKRVRFAEDGRARQAAAASTGAPAPAGARSAQSAPSQRTP